jgi:hypothetical protein
VHRSPSGKARPPQGRVRPTWLDVTLDGLRQVYRRIGQRQLDVGDWDLFGALVLQQMTRAESRQERQIAKIMAEAARKKAREAGSETGASGPDGESTSSSSSTGTNAIIGAQPETSSRNEGKTDAVDPKERKRPRGHGRNGASSYRQAQHFSHPLGPGVLGALCEACRIGKLHRYREKVVIRIVGQPLFSAEAHHHEQGRCRSCGHIVRAQSPDYVCQGLGSDYIRYDWSACAMLLVLHYFGGAPFKRLESLHEGWGVLMPDANQWDLVSAGDDLLLPLYRAIEQHAIEKATSFRIDDTGAMVLSLQKQITAELAALEALGESTKDVRTGINATGVYWETPNGPVLLFYTGRHHAGEIVDRLLRHRLRSNPKLVKCTDGASKNFAHEHADELVESTCNAHAFLKFRAIKDKHPAEYAEAGRVYQQVFDHDDEAKALGLTPMDRMLYHQERSKPLLQQLKQMCEEKITSKRVEPSSQLWEPLTFILNQWDRLTRFCDVAGVPLDTNLVEQALILPVRYFSGSFNYHTEDGAVVGDRAMSLIATARAHDVEPVAYLTECLRCHEDLAQRPEHYLPWLYRARLEAAAASSAACPRAPPPEASGPAPEAASSAPPARGLRDLSPQVRKSAARRVAAPDQHLQFAGEQR